MGKTKLPTTGRKGGPLGKVKRESIKNDIISLVNKGKLNEITSNKLSYAREKKINRNTLNTLLCELKDLSKEEIPDLIKVDILKTYERMKARIMYWWDKCEKAPEEEQSFHLEKQVFKEMREVLKDFKQTCIDLGIIERIAENINLQSTNVNVNIDLNAISEEILNKIEQ